VARRLRTSRRRRAGRNSPSRAARSLRGRARGARVAPGRDVRQVVRPVRSGGWIARNRERPRRRRRRARSLDPDRALGRLDLVLVSRRPSRTGEWEQRLVRGRRTHSRPRSG
jgi:hypothetical protein